jgi:hypothetical protein
MEEEEEEDEGEEGHEKVEEEGEAATTAATSTTKQGRCSDSPSFSPSLPPSHRLYIHLW